MKGTCLPTPTLFCLVMRKREANWVVGQAFLSVHWLSLRSGRSEVFMATKIAVAASLPHRAERLCLSSNDQFDFVMTATPDRVAQTPGHREAV
jgi:hypothetical protein